jgi:7-cyano-7-deazaguanine synthase
MTTLPMCKVANLLPVVLNVASYYAHGVEVDEIDLALTAEQIELNPHWPEFFHSFADVLQQFCTEQPRIQFRTPFAELTKAQVLARGKELGVYLADTWTCTRGRELHDGVCLSCQSRKAAFRDAKLEDPTVYLDSRC